METTNHLDLSLLERLTISWLIPVNTIGYAIKNRTNPVATATFYWGWKRDKYEGIVNTLQTGDKLDEMVSKNMPLLSYRLMIRVGLNRTDIFSHVDYEHWAQEYPINWDL